MNGHYNNQLDNLVGNLAASQANIDWMDAQRLTAGQNICTLYCPNSYFDSAVTPNVIAYGATKNILFSRAVSAMSEVNKVIAYNAAHPAQKIVKLVTEYEPYNNNPGGYPEMKTFYQQMKAALQAAGSSMKIVTYMGWPAAYFWKTIVQYSDEINLHCYLPSANMTANNIWDYVRGRLAEIATQCANQCKKIRVNILFSSEPIYAQAYYTTHPFTDSIALFMTKWNASATSIMRQWITVGQSYIFVSSTSQVARP